MVHFMKKFMWYNLQDSLVKKMNSRCTSYIRHCMGLNKLQELGTGGLILHQKKYASEILKRFEMDQCNPALTPSEHRLQLSRETEEKDVDSTEYRRLIGSLRYLCNTRPDIAYSVGIVSRHMERPKMSHLSAAKRILRYIKGTMDYGIVFNKPDKKDIELIGYTDSNWCGDKDDRKSTAGYVFLYE